MSLRTTFKFATGQFDEAVRDIYSPIAKAGTAAMRDVADRAKTDGRESIKAAGFSRRWQNTLRGDVFPKKGVSANAAALVYHRIPYAEVFETGSMIRGKPQMWVPVKGVSKKLARKKTTPDLFERMVGDVFSLKTRGNVPILAAKMSVSKAAARRGPPYKVTMAGLRRGAAGQGIIRAVPVFMGLDTVRISKKFDVYPAIERAADDLPRLYLKYLEDT